MRVSLEYKNTCPVCNESVFGDTLDEAYNRFKKHIEECKIKVWSSEYYLIDEAGEPVEGLDEVLERLYMDGLIEFVD